MESNVKKNWISKDKIYKPIKKRGLIFIEQGYFLHATRLNWMHRYITLSYNDFWTSLLDMHLGITKTERHKILEWGPEEFNKPIQQCHNRLLKPFNLNENTIRKICYTTRNW